MLSKLALRNLAQPTCSLRIALAYTAGTSLPSSFNDFIRQSSSSSSTRWKTRQTGDHFAREAKVQGLKSRAAFKLLQINDKHRVFKKGDTVIDLGYAPGSWSQVAANRTAPRGRVIGVDILPAQPPRGVSTIQGDFLSPEVQAEVRTYVLDPERGRPRREMFAGTAEDEGNGYRDGEDVWAGPQTEARLESSGGTGYVQTEREMSSESQPEAETAGLEELFKKSSLADTHPHSMTRKQRDQAQGRVVDVVLSDMSEPWDQTAGFGSRSVSNAYSRMMNTTGIAFKDHVGSMDLCLAALTFGFDTLRQGGHFVCKFYQGAEDKLLEKRLRRLFEKVHRDKPSASRSESREGYFVALRRKEAPSKDEIFAE